MPEKTALQPVQLLTIPMQREKEIAFTACNVILCFFQGEGCVSMHPSKQFSAEHIPLSTDCEKGDVLVCAPIYSISVRCDSYQSVTLGVLRIDPDTVYSDTQLQQTVDSYLSDDRKIKKHHFSGSALEHIEKFFSLIYTELSTSRPYSLRIYEMLSSAFTVHLAREYHASIPANAEKLGYVKHTLGIAECVKQSIAARYDEPLTLSGLAAEHHVTAPYLSALFKKDTGMRFSDYLIATRIKHAIKLIVDSDEMVIDIATAVGFNSTAHFDWTFRKYTGFSPLEYRKHFKNIRNN